MSVEEAREVATDFQTAKFIPPPRTIGALREMFGDGKAIPNNCKLKWAKDKRQIALTLEGMWTTNSPGGQSHYAAHLVVLAEKTFSTGRFDEALDAILDAENILPPKGMVVRHAVFANQRARLHARLGDLSAAERAMAESTAFWERAGFGPNPTDWLKDPRGKIYSIAGRASIAWLRGDLPLAEIHFRNAIQILDSTGRSSHNHIDGNQLRANLAQVLLQQRRHMEADAVARTTIEWLGITSPQALHYDGGGAAPVVVMAAIMLDQGKAGDAEYLARIAVNMHESSCSEPQSLGLTEARRIWIDALIELADWPGVLRQVDHARSALADFAELFERQFGTSLAYIEAELYAGDAAIGRSLANNVRQETLDVDGAGSYRVAEIEGILALADTKLGRTDAALSGFAKAMPALISGAVNERNATAINGRRQRIFKGYMDLLAGLARSGTTEIAGLDVTGEMLRITSAQRLNRVQQAVSAGAVRAAAGNPELAALVRQEQDLNEQARALGQALAYVQSAPAAGVEVASADELQDRLRTVDLARRTLRTEILGRFPDYAELISPRPMTASELRSRLAPGQVLVAYHVDESASYVWALSPGGATVFAEIDISRDELSRKIATLRAAVDPGPVRTLADIPVFDVALAHELYTLLLEPVRAGWKDAGELLVVADGPLGALPFSMLTTAPDAPRQDSGVLFDRYREAKWLVKRLAVVSLPSINALKAASGTRLRGTTKRRPFVGFGDPIFSARQLANAATSGVAARSFALRSAPLTRGVRSADLAMLPRLPDTRDEILAVARALGADPARDVYLGKDASEQRVKSMDLAAYDVISFATHGLIPGDLNGLNEPALALSSPDVTNGDGDGLLTMSEILGLKLDADFAVLSACNTAAADGAGGEAVSGLGRAFFYAGAKALLVSNWPVNSASTTDLMGRLFKALAKNATLTRAESLRQAKLFQITKGGYGRDGKLVYSYAHPIFWAPFTIFGDGGGAQVGS